jgi:hemin uptake protein HemP
MQDSRKAPKRLKAHEQPATQGGQVDIRELVGRRRQVTISHGGDNYTLRITRNGKLILTK